MTDYSKPNGECPFRECLVSALEDKLAQYAALLRRALEALDNVTKWADRHYYLVTTEEMIRAAQALAPDLRAALEEK